jgi:hypothetical protein
MEDSLHESKVDDTTARDGDSALCIVSCDTCFCARELTLAKEPSTSSTDIGVLFIRILSEKDITSLNSSVLYVSSTFVYDWGSLQSLLELEQIELHPY